jgi:hypothetical protein
VSAVYNLVDNRIVEAAPATKRIALIGSAPSSVQLAPYDDSSWTIWACSPGAVPHIKRCDAWFELHPLSDPHAGFSPDYIAWMATLTCPVYLTDPAPAIPSGAAYPRAEMVEKYGPYFFTSSLSWMLALALEQSPAEIGLWGVDMSATEEYAQQRPGCHHFLTIAKERGVKITVPAESDLLRAPMQYGFSSGSVMYRKLCARRAELTKRAAEAAAQYEHFRNEWNFVNGALDDLKYILNTWVD